MRKGALLLGLLLPVGAWAAKDDGPITVIVAGGAQGDAKSPVLVKLRERLAQADPERTVVVFTGNYLEAELPGDGEPGREEAVAALDAHVAAVKDFWDRDGRVWFLPGHTDFAAGGTKVVKRLRKLLNKKLSADGKKRDAMPESACASSELIELSGDVGLLLVNSEWWMQDSSADPNFNDGCLVKTRKAFLGNITDTMRKYRGRRLIVASHHPLKSYGEHGGAFTAAAHAEPFPIAGTAWVLAREAGLVAQYQNFPLVQGYSLMLKNEGARYGAFVFVSGHDANLQYVTVDLHSQIISGSTASSGRPVVEPNEGDFSSASSGWAELNLRTTGEGAVRFVGPDGTALHEKALPQVRPLVTDPPKEVPPMPESPVTARFWKRDVWRFPWGVRLLLGTYYAHVFQLELPFEVLDLATFEGGLKPYKIGGGQQSNSIRAKDPNGGDWAIRATTKDASRLLPYPLSRVTLFGRMMEHAFTATHPEAPLALEKMSEAAGVLHLEPRLMYLPDQEGLGEYRGFITDEVVIVEQRPAPMKNGAVPPKHLGGRDANTQYEDYDDLFEKVLDKPWKHRLDQEAMLRARLLDMLVGDWDRHRGQWRFAGNEDERGDIVWQPVAMDRDQAFAHYDGLGLMIARLFVAQARSTVAFDGSYSGLRWLNYNARDNDAFTLNRISHDRWMAIAKELQTSLSDAVIDEAMATWRQETYALDGARIAEALKLRRDQLLEVAEESYRRLARGVDVVGSMDDDRFELHFAPEGTVRVVIVRKENDKPYYARTFDPSETAEVNLYALDGDDTLEVHGEPHEELHLRFVGGEGKDAVKTHGGGEAKASALEVFDRQKGMTIDPSLKVEDGRGELAYLNQYEPRENHEPDYGTFMPGLMVNRDVGVFLGGTYTHVSPAWKKKPFGARHIGSAYFATATLGAAFDYQLMLPNSFKLIDQTIELSLRTPLYTRNFFGFTNEVRGFTEPLEYYRVRQAVYEARWGLQYGGSRARAGMQVLGQIISTDRTQGRFIATAPEADEAFGPRYFAGARVFAEVITFDSRTLPRKGVALHASATGRYDVAAGRDFSMNVKAAGAFAVPIDRGERFVVLSRALVEGIVGRHPFYFAPTVGAGELRAYNFQQFAGDVAFAHTTDLRVEVFRIESTVPSTIGVNASVDHGGVFGNSVSGGRYHVSLGGGVWWSIVDLIGVWVGYHRSIDGAERFAVLLGPLFADMGF